MSDLAAILAKRKKKQDDAEARDEGFYSAEADVESSMRPELAAAASDTSTTVLPKAGAKERHAGATQTSTGKPAPQSGASKQPESPLST
eukprot:3426404-Rhodomonas_salina.1